VAAVAKSLKRRGWIGESFRTTKTSHLFLDASYLGFERDLRFGDGRVLSHDERQLMSALREGGPYQRAEAFPAGSTLRISVVPGLDISTLAVSFWLALKRELAHFGLEMVITGEEIIKGQGRAEIERALDRLTATPTDLVLAHQPDSWRAGGDGYNNFKSLTVGRGIPSQVVHRLTLVNRYALPNIVLGVLAKTGHIPFVLAEPLPYADLVVGIDIARRRKTRLAGSLNATAVARVYLASGELLRYGIHDAHLEGETVPEAVLQALFPTAECQGKRIVVHRDGYFRGGEKRALQAWGEAIGADFLLVEVIKSGSPRLYSWNGLVKAPAFGTAFRISDHEALVVSNPPPHRVGTPQPLRIRSTSPFPIEQAIHSVLSLSLLHYGSLRAPRLPVTLH
jgi:hypothetical protein